MLICACKILRGASVISTEMRIGGFVCATAEATKAKATRPILAGFNFYSKIPKQSVREDYDQTTVRPA